MHAVVEQDEPEIEFFKENNVAEMNLYFRRRQFITVGLCIAVLVLSQADLKLSTELLSSTINDETKISTT